MVEQFILPSDIKALLEKSNILDFDESLIKTSKNGILINCCCRFHLCQSILLPSCVPIDDHSEKSISFFVLGIFLENWIQTLFQVVNILATWSTKRAIIQLRDRFHGLIAFPLGILVSKMFWALFLYDRSFIIHRDHAIHIPPSVNHLLHTLPAVTVITHGLTTAHDYPKSITTPIITLSTISIAYTFM
ncbi:hypothetical protein ACOME3_005470 [Neoechinorhynchus agilis]